jgi:hypothetical protein
MCKEGNMGIEIGGLLGLIILVGDIWAIVKTVGSSASTGGKVFWIVLILILPVLGLIIWLVAGPRPVKERL